AAIPPITASSTERMIYMQALVRNQALQIELQAISEPQLSAADEVKIKIEYCSLCRDDMHTGDALAIFGGSGIIGHEAAGVVVEAGARAQQDGFLPGVRVAIIPMEFCGSCPSCLAGQPQYCPEAHISSGVIAEYIIRKPSQLIKIPHKLSYQQAVLMETVGDVMAAISKLKLDFDSDVLLVGGGYTGQLFLRLLRLRGIHRIAVIEPIEVRRQLALEHGADAAYGPAHPSLQVKLLEQTNFRGFPVVIDTSADAEMLEFVQPCVTRGGTMLLFAYCDTQSKLTFPSLNMYMNNISVIWSCMCSPRTMEQAGDIIQRLRLEELITAEYPIKKSKQAYENYLTTAQIKIGIRVG
ncbi:MAG: alcohol dehydrogenase catalytic domain-containing protein, partial [Angelakisella sp.]